MTAQLRLRGLPWLLVAALFLALGPALLGAMVAPANPLADAATCSAHADSGSAPAPDAGDPACRLCLLASLHHAGLLPAPPPFPAARTALLPVRLASSPKPSLPARRGPANARGPPQA